jgi:hypothetical protein
MTLIIQKPTGAKLNLRKELPADTDADAYIAAVEAADTAAGSPGGLESGVKFAIKNFVLCCKQDGIWDAIKASCILAGARTLEGALVPLVGTAPTNVNFVSGDYNRKTGLVGANTKYLNANRAGNADPQNNQHVSVYATTANTASSAIINSNSAGAGATAISRFGSALEFRSQNSVSNNFTAAPTGLIALSRSSSSEFVARFSEASQTVLRSSQTPASGNYFVFAWANLTGYSDARLAFYSIGESLNLALLDARVTDLINAFGAAIP